MCLQRHAKRTVQFGVSLTRLLLDLCVFAQQVLDSFPKECGLRNARAQRKRLDLFQCFWSQVQSNLSLPTFLMDHHFSVWVFTGKLNGRKVKPWITPGRPSSQARVPLI